MQKWSEAEDKELTRLVKKYGTNDWNMIRQKFRSNRTRDSVLKRWHLKLKYEMENKTRKTRSSNDRLSPEQKKETSTRKDNSKAPSRIHKQPRPDNNVVKVRRTRMGGPEQKRKVPKYIMRKPLVNNRFQRLRSFLDNQGPRVNKPRDKDRPTKKMEENAQKVVSGGRSSSQSIQESSSEKQPVNYQFAWTNADDEKLKNLVLHEGLTDWSRLAEAINGCSKEEAQKRWRKQIYKKIKLDDRVGGFLKYSNQEDTVLVAARRNRLTWDQISEFLPGRSSYSIEARYRRVGRPEVEFETSKNRHFMMREFLKKIVQKQRTIKAPFEEVNQALAG